MVKRRSPLVTVEGLSVLEYPAPIRIGSPAWIEWLECHDRFRFECDFDAKFTAYKSYKGYWTCQRRYNGRLRHEYLGDSRHLTWEKLEQTAKTLNMGDSAYWNQKYPSPILSDLEDRRSPSLIKPPEYETVNQPSGESRETPIMNQPIEVLIQERDDYRDTVDALLSDCQRYQKHIKELESKLSLQNRERILSALGVPKQNPLYQRVKLVLDQVLGSVP